MATQQTSLTKKAPYTYVNEFELQFDQSASESLENQAQSIELFALYTVRISASGNCFYRRQEFVVRLGDQRDRKTEFLNDLEPW